MKMRNLVIAAAALAAGCGSGTADLYLFDAPPAGVTGVTIQVKSMDVHVDADWGKADSAAPDDTSIDNDGKWQTLEVDKQIDLVQHEGETAADLLGQLTLPDGKITQLRLVIDVSDPALNYVTFQDSSTCQLDTSRVEQKGIKINHVFKAFKTEGGDHHEIYVHFDLATSLTPSGSCFLLEPQVELRTVIQNGKPEQI